MHVLIMAVQIMMAADKLVGISDGVMKPPSSFVQSGDACPVEDVSTTIPPRRSKRRRRMDAVVPKRTKIEEKDPTALPLRRSKRARVEPSRFSQY